MPPKTQSSGSILKPKVLPGMGRRKQMFCHLFLSEPDTAAISGKASPGA